MHHFHVPDMQCGGCLRTIRQAIQKLEPQARVEGQLESRVVAIDSALEKASLQTGLERAGYTAQPVQRVLEGAR